MSTGNVKGGALLSRLHFVREQRGEAGIASVLARLDESDRAACAQILTNMWYPFELNQRLDEAIAAELALGQKVFVMIGEKSAAHNLANAHKVFIMGQDPHGLLKRAAQIYAREPHVLEARLPHRRRVAQEGDRDVRRHQRPRPRDPMPRRRRRRLRVRLRVELTRERSDP
jgi:hypothetical protein